MSVKELILQDVGHEDKTLMSKLYDLIVSGESTNEEARVFSSVLETSSRKKVLERQLAIYESYLN